MRFLAQPRRRSGFTLIELIISAAVMALILASAYACLTSGIASQRLVESRTEALQNGRVALALMSADLRSACPLSKEMQFLGMPRMIEAIEADNLDFATHHYTPQRERESDFCEVSYFIAKDPDSGEFSLFRRRDATPDPEPLSGGSREEIVRGVAGLRFEYYDGWDWYTEWGDPEGRRQGANALSEQPNLSGLPEAVRITLWIRPGSQPRSTGANEGNAEEPPLMFQTVARLNLASIALSRGASSAPATETNSPATRETDDGGIVPAP